MVKDRNLNNEIIYNVIYKRNEGLDEKTPTTLNKIVHGKKHIILVMLCSCLSFYCSKPTYTKSPCISISSRSSKQPGDINMRGRDYPKHRDSYMESDVIGACSH